MKTILSILAACVMLCAFSAPVFLVACNTTQQTTAYKTLKSVQDASVAGLTIYGNAFKSGKITPERRAQVDALYKKYQSAFAVAIDAAQFNYNAPVPGELLAAINDFLNLINTLK